VLKGMGRFFSHLLSIPTLPIAIELIFNLIYKHLLDRIFLFTFCRQVNCEVFVIRELKLDNTPPQRPLHTSQLSSSRGDLIFTCQYLILMCCQKAF